MLVLCQKVPFLLLYQRLVLDPIVPCIAVYYYRNAGAYPQGIPTEFGGLPRHGGQN